MDINKHMEINKQIIYINTLIDQVTKIVNDSKGTNSLISQRNKNTLHGLGEKILMAMNYFSSYIEKDQSLMMETIYVNGQQVQIYSWMMWTMQWFEAYEKYME